jgi:hypothetical protein
MKLVTLMSYYFWHTPISVTSFVKFQKNMLSACYAFPRKSITNALHFLKHVTTDLKASLEFTPGLPPTIITALMM